MNLSVKTKIAKPCFGRTPQSLFPIYFMIHDGHSEIPNFEKVRELILWSQVYERIERAVDMVSDLGDTLEEVVLKYV